MNAKQQRIIQPIIQALTLQQQGLVGCASCKLILYLLNLALAIHLFTNLQLKAQSIAIAMLAIYLLLVKFSIQGRMWAYVVRQSTKLQRMFMGMAVLVICDTKYMSFISMLVCVVCYGCYIYQIVYRTKPLCEFQQNGLAVSVLVVVQWQLIILRYEGYIAIEWAYLMVVLLIGALFLLFLISILALYFLMATPRQAENDYEYQDSGWYKHRMRQNYMALFILYSTYFSLFGLLLDAYLTQSLYKYFLAAIIGVGSIEMLMYTLLFKKLVLLFLDFHHFGEKIMVRLKNGKYTKKDEIKDRKYLTEAVICEQLCYYCEDKAKVLHTSCGCLTFCYGCFQKWVLQKQSRCMRCRLTSSHYDYMFVCDRQEMSSRRETAIVSKYLESGEMLTINL